MITIFSPMRTFESLIGEVQKNAVESWLNIHKDVEIILFEDESKSIHHNIKKNDKILIIKDYPNSFSGVPLLDGMYDIVNKIAKNEIICYLTADILLPKSFGKKIIEYFETSNSRFSNFVGISCRYDLTDSKLVRKNNESIEKYFNRIKIKAKKRERSGIDLWVTHKNQNIKYLPFPIGRCLTDNWFVTYCKENKITIIDISDDNIIIHQNHDKPSKSNDFFELEKYICHLIFEKGSSRGGDIYDSDFLYTNKTLNKPSGLRYLHQKLYYFKFYRFLIGLRRKIKNKYYRIEIFR